MRTANTLPYGVTRPDAESYADFIAGVRASVCYCDSDANAAKFFALSYADRYRMLGDRPRVLDPDTYRRAANLAADFDLERTD